MKQILFGRRRRQFTNPEQYRVLIHHAELNRTNTDTPTARTGLFARTKPQPAEVPTADQKTPSNGSSPLENGQRERKHHNSTVVEQPSAAIKSSKTNLFEQFPDPLVESLRYMLTCLQRDEQLPKRLTVTSAMRQEGVSFISLALAAIIAHDMMKRVCLVDLNWWWPNPYLNPPQPLATPATPIGVSGLIQHKLEWNTALMRTADPNLFILPAGHVAPQQRPIYARHSALQSMLAELDQRMDYVILDTPALLSTTDAIPLASLGSACALIIRHGISTRGAVEHALHEVSHMPLLGTIMNRAHSTIPPWIFNWIPPE